MAEDNIFAAIDIGSAETKVLVAELFPRLKIIGAFSGKTEGMRKGEIVDLGALKESVHAVIRGAENLAGISGRIRRACLSLSSLDLSGNAVVGVTSVKSGGVSDDDILSAKIDAYKHDASLPAGRWIVHHIFRRYLLDGKEQENPVGKKGRTLEYDMWVADAEENFLTELFQIPNSYGMRVENLVFSSLASAESVRTFSRTDRDRLVIDIGAGTTDYVLYRFGALVCTGVIPVGGLHCTNDISVGLDIEPQSAECLKIKFGKAWAQTDDVGLNLPANLKSADDVLQVDFETEFVSGFKMNTIIEARLRELFGLVWREVTKRGEFSGTIQLTGGTSQLKGIDKLAAAVCGNSDVRLGTPNHGFARAYCEPKFATVVGLAKIFADAASRKRKVGGSWWQRLFREMFR